MSFADLADFTLYSNGTQSLLTDIMAYEHLASPAQMALSTLLTAFMALRIQHHLLQWRLVRC